MPSSQRKGIWMIIQPYFGGEAQSEKPVSNRRAHFGPRGHNNRLHLTSPSSHFPIVHHAWLLLVVAKPWISYQSNAACPS
jgi:hypothetical protein